ncbi:MAG: hypothetical protein JNM10_01770 [Planctomycetia bacterium]|nr:hypothetical protein [Planctomycetia bacterium]
MNPRSHVRAAAVLVALAAVAAPASGAPREERDVASLRATLEKHAKDPYEQRPRTGALRALGRLGGPAAAEVVCGVLGDPFVHVRDHAVSALIDLLEGPEADATRAWLMAGPLVDRTSADVRRGVATALGVRGGPTAAAALAAAAAKAGDPPVLGALARALERVGDPAAATTLLPAAAARDGAAAGAVLRALGGLSKDAAVVAALEAGLARKEPLARAGAVDGLVAAAPAALVARVDALLADKAVEPRIALADALSRLTDGEARAAALALFSRLAEDPSWRVRAACYEAGLALWDKALVPLLVERLRREHGRMVGDVVRALETLTGEAVGRDPDLWASWWSTRGPGLSLGARPAPDRFGRFRRAARPPSAADAEDRRTAAFYRLPVQSTQLAFLFDYSGSMRDAGRAGAKGSKADAARAEFAQVAAALGKGTVYDLFVYRYLGEYPPAPRLTRALGALTAANAAAARKASEWLGKEVPRGFGAFYDGLVAVAAEEVDTIVLLSDGVPSMGTYDRGFRLIDEFVRANRFRRVAVDTVLVGTKGADREFMADLADATGGRFMDAGN